MLRRANGLLLDLDVDADLLEVELHDLSDARRRVADVVCRIACTLARWPPASVLAPASGSRPRAGRFFAVLEAGHAGRQDLVGAAAAERSRADADHLRAVDRVVRRPGAASTLPLNGALSLFSARYQNDEVRLTK